VLSGNYLGDGFIVLKTFCFRNPKNVFIFLNINPLSLINNYLIKDNLKITLNDLDSAQQIKFSDIRAVCHYVCRGYYADKPVIVYNRQFFYLVLYHQINCIIQE